MILQIEKTTDAAGVETSVEKKDESARDIAGVARVGDLAKGLLLTGSMDIFLE